MTEQNKLSAYEQAVLQQSVTGSYFLSGSIERANRKFETAFQVLEKAREYREKGHRHWLKSLWWFAAAFLWWVFSVVMWIMR